MTTISDFVVIFLPQGCSQNQLLAVCHSHMEVTDMTDNSSGGDPHPCGQWIIPNHRLHQTHHSGQQRLFNKLINWWTSSSSSLTTPLCLSWPLIKRHTLALWWSEGATSAINPHRAALPSFAQITSALHLLYSFKAAWRTAYREAGLKKWGD